MKRHFHSSLLTALLSAVFTGELSAQVTLTFEEFPDGTRITDLYAPEGVHFLNDYSSGGLYRASPKITAHPNAPSPGNVLVNDQDDCELSSSRNAPMVLWLDQPAASVSMDLGTIQDLPGPCSCPSTSSAVISFRDCDGALLSQLDRTVSTAFDASVQFNDPQGRIQRVDIDYGDTACPEAIDNLTFTVGTAVCMDNTPPAILFTSHTNDQLVNQSRQTVSGEVVESGILSMLLINGVEAPYRLESDGRYHFSQTVFLQEGNNTITGIARNAAGLLTTAQLRLFLGTPASATLTSFHLTQRGVMLDRSCDVDDPLVAGKSAIARVSLRVNTAGGMETYASSVKMNVWRRQSSGADELVDSFFGTTYSPQLSFFTSPSDLAAIHFWLPGYLGTFDAPGDYRFTFEAYVGSNQIGSELSPCGGQYVTFTETKPIRLLILPVERGSWDPVFNGTDHVKNFYQQLDTVARAYPVRDGFSYLEGLGRGLIYEELNPLRLCDGTVTTKDLDYCGGTGPAWQFIDKNPSGVLERANDEIVADPQNNDICGDNDYVGGRIVDDTKVTHNFNPTLGVYRTAGMVDWPSGKHTRVIDEDRDGDIDAADLALCAVEFFDAETGAWTTDFNRYDPGETFRFFRDLNGNFCPDDGEPRSLAIQRGMNQRGLLWDPARKALDERNKSIAGTASDFQFASLWFPEPIFAPQDFGAPGPGQGNEPGTLSWIKVTDIVAMAHELGHNFGLSHLGCYTGVSPCDLEAMENAWAVYIDGKSKAPDEVFAIMDFSRDPVTEVFAKANYQSLFNELKVDDGAAAQSLPESEEIDQFVVSGLLYDDGHLENVTASVSTGLDATPTVPGSPYSLVFGQGNTVSETLPFALDPPPTAPKAGQQFPINYTPFNVVSPFPINAEWAELRNEDQTLARLDRSAEAPSVQILHPNGGESFGAEERVVIEWEVNDADSGDLRSSIFYSSSSPGQPPRWQLLAGALRGTSFPWNTINASGTSSGLIRIVVTDGFNTAEDQSDGTFSVAGKPPQAVILEPAPGQTFLQCARPIVRGMALDLEGAISRVRWSVDGETVSTDPEARLEPLSPGARVLRFEAFDADGVMSFDEVTIEVLADSDCDGMTDEFEEEHGLNGGSGEDAGADNDGDGLPNFDEAVHGTIPTEPDSDGDLFSDGLEVDANSDPTDPLNTPFTTGILTNALYLTCGGEATLDAIGRLWRRDAPFLATPDSNVASFDSPVNISLLGDPNVPQAMLLTERWRAGDLNYEIPAPDGAYSVVLYFSENCRACVNPDYGGTGPANTARIFDIQVEDLRVDAYNQADAALPPPDDGMGATYTATEVAFRDVAVVDGLLNIRILDRGAGNPPENPAIKGIAILQQAADGLAPPRILSIHRVENFFRIEVDPGANLAAFFSGLAGFALEESPDLENWMSTEFPASVAGNRVFFDPLPAGTARFYRIAAIPVNP